MGDTGAMRTGVVVATALVGAVVVAGGIAAIRHSGARAPAAAAPSTTPTHVTPPPPSGMPAPAPGASPELAADFAALQATLNGTVGLGLAAVGGGDGDPILLGDWQTGPAWSTIKVPLVIAALRGEHAPELDDAMTKAITESDNAAAESIWASLGAPAAAAAAVQDVLSQSGDPTVVESRRVRPEYTAFGQTTWPLTDQTRYTAVALCDPRNAPVLELMGRIEGDQRWGIGTIPDAKFKGGWGPAPSGSYLVRQLGIIPTPGGMTAIAVAAEPNSGSFSDGIEMLNQVSAWLSAHLAELPSGHCGT
jgi:hypothetical protein